MAEMSDCDCPVCAALSPVEAEPDAPEPLDDSARAMSEGAAQALRVILNQRHPELVWDVQIGGR